MSRRYGRNQKRTHRQRIAELEDALAWERSARDSQRRLFSEALAEQRRQMDALVEEIREVCRDSALLPAREAALPGEGPWRLVMPESPRTRWVAHNDSIAALPEPMFVAMVDVYEVRAFLEAHSTEFKKIVHVKLPGQEVRFAVSREAMRAFGRHGLRSVAENLLSMLMGALRSDKEAA